MDVKETLSKLKEQYGKNPFVENNGVTMVDINFLFFVTGKHLEAEKTLNNLLQKTKHVLTLPDSDFAEVGSGKSIAGLL